MGLYYLFIILAGCSHLVYQPTVKHYIDPRKQLDFEYEDVYFDSKDGTKLHGWFYRSQTKEVKGTVVQFHGNAQNISTHFFSLVWLVEHGYNFFTFDYRGYGKSTGVPDQKGVYEDALAAMDQGREFQRKNGNGKLIFYAQSVGGNIAARAFPDWKHHKDVSLLVLDSTFGSYQELTFYKTSHSWLLFLLSPLSFIAMSDEYAADKVIPKIKEPVLVIVGFKDQVVPQKFGKKIFKQLTTEKKWLWKFPEGGHIDVFYLDKGRYRERFTTFLDSPAIK